MARLGHIRAMPRTTIALLGGLLGFLLYVMVVVALADHVLELHWLVQLVYFTVAGIIWAWPAKWLMFWAVRNRG